MSNATSLSDSVTAENANTKRDMGLAGGKTKVIYDAVTFDYDVASGDLFKMAKLPANVRVVDAYLVGPAKTTGIFDIGLLAASGTALDADKIIVKSCNLDAAATRFKRADALSTYLNTYGEDSAYLYIVATEAITATEGADTKLELVVSYTLD